jgi:NADPH:quinone reductase-like Zn-dependent oxidoreductase
LNFFIDVDNSARYKVVNDIEGIDDFKNIIKDFKRDGLVISFLIKNLGILTLDDAILCFSQRTVILKCTKMEGAI